MGAILPKDLWWGVKNQALEIIYSLVSWKDGSFIFGDTADELVNERIVLSINTSTVIMEGIRRLDESAVIRVKITSLDMVFMKVQGAMPDFGSLEMSEHEVALYNNLDGKRSI